MAKENSIKMKKKPTIGENILGLFRPDQPLAEYLQMTSVDVSGEQ